MDLWQELVSWESWAGAVDVLIRMGLAALLGALIGYEREKSGRPAGIRTPMLLIIGVVLYSEVSRAFGGGDDSRIAAQIVTGVGFRGAGTIMRHRWEVKGLTSAASLWATAAIGMAVATGGAFYAVAIVGTLLTMVTLAWVSKLEAKLVPFAEPTTLLVELDDHSWLTALFQLMQESGISVEGVRIVSTEPKLHAQLEVKGERDKIMRAVGAAEGVAAANWGDS